jgi:hypothetical protein
MSDIDALLDELRQLPAGSPRNAHELAELLNRVKSVAGRWADVLYDVHESARSVAEFKAAVALEIAFRRAEQSYVELEIALSDLKGVSRS